jgi:uncharacterized protein (TIGR02266 family)
VKSKCVIVADDTAFVRDRFRTALESAGHRASTVGDAAGLLARVKDNGTPVDLVILDLRLPQTQGVSLVRSLRRIDGFSAPIVVFSGTIANAEEVRELSSLGVAGYINEYAAVQHIVPALSPHLFPAEYRRRSGPRVVIGVPVSYRLGNTISSAVTLNVGRGGLAVRTTSPLEKGTELRVRFRLPGGPEIDAEASVAWSNPRVGMGLQLTKISDADQAGLDRFIHLHFFTNRKA